MAKGLAVRLGDEESSFQIAKIDREKLYGRKERIVVDEDGKTCVSAHLTSDGAALIPSGGAAYLYVDDSFDVVDRGALIGVDEEGKPLALCPSTLGVPQPAQEVDASRVLDHIVTSVYSLMPETLGAKLAERLAAGAIIETRFNWREDYRDAPAFLLQNAEGVFALVATPTGFEFVERQALPQIEEDGDEGEEDLDFAMM
jgi:hypothetical protein